MTDKRDFRTRYGTNHWPTAPESGNLNLADSQPNSTNCLELTFEKNVELSNASKPVTFPFAAMYNPPLKVPQRLDLVTLSRYNSLELELGDWAFCVGSHAWQLILGNYLFQDLQKSFLHARETWRGKALGFADDMHHL